VIARVVENWLDSATEKEFQIPFCHVLNYEGKTVVHLTRHCPMEMGKDIIALEPDGTPCAYQLKNIGGAKLSKDEWRTKLLPQMDELVLQGIEHPAVKPGKHHRSFLVINGELDEEAIASVRQYNQGLQNRRFPKEQRLGIIVKGKLYKAFMELGTDLWPPELAESRALLELYLELGDSCFPKEKLAVLLEQILPLRKKVGNKKGEVSKAECQRILTSAAILTSLASTSFARCDNHVAILEAWTLYAAYAMSLSERCNLPRKYWFREVKLSLDAMYEALCRLCEEIPQRMSLVEGNPVLDFPFHRIRITHVSGLLAVLGLWRIHRGEPHEAMDDHIHDFVEKHLKHLQLWGEYAVPQFLSIYFYMNATDATLKSTSLLHNLFSSIIKLAQAVKDQFLPDPYCNPEEWLLETMCRNQQEKRHNFQDGSFSIESLMHLFVRTNMKQMMKMLWPDITRVQFKKFTPDVISDYYLWYVEEGTTDSIFLPPSKEWNELMKEARENTGSEIPSLIKEYPIFYIAFLCVYPHRINSSGVRWLDTTLTNAFISRGK